MQNRSQLALLSIVIIAVIAIVGVFVLGSKDSDKDDDSKNEETTSSSSSSEETTGKVGVGESKTFTLSEQNGSGQSGTVTLEEVGDQVQVTIELSNPSSDEQPAHIHNGSCPTPGSVAFPLENVVNGASVTLIDSTLADLEAMGNLAVNVHKSASDSSVYNACGNLMF